MASIQNISDMVEGFVSGGVPAKEFANSFVPIFKSSLKSDEYVRSVALAVHSQISHYFHALISEDECRSSLKPYGAALVRPVVVIEYPVLSAPRNPYQAFAPDSKGELVPV